MAVNIFSRCLSKIDLTNFGLTDEQSNLPRWSQLPAPALELIYSYLCLKDRYNMSMVCRSWNNAFKSPGVWSRFAINLSEDYIPEKYFSAVGCVCEFGEYFRHVRIVCGTHDWALFQLKLFLKVITSKCQLFSLRFERMMLLGDSYKDEDIMKGIINLLESQRHLKEIVFDDCVFIEKAGYQIFAAIGKHSTNLKKMKLFNFYHESLNGRKSDFVPETKQVFEAFMSLEEIEMDGTVFENMVTVCSDMEPALSPLKSKSLKSIKLNFWDRYKFLYTHCLKNTRKAIKTFKNQCPELKIDVLAIDLDVRALRYLGELRNMDPRSMQILHSKYCYDVGSIVKYLIFPENGYHLESLEIRRIKTTNNVVQDIISLLQTCPNLRELILESENPIFGIETVFKYMIENYPVSFKLFSLVMNGEMSLEDMDMFRKMKEEYVCKLRRIEICLKMKYEFF